MTSTDKRRLLVIAGVLVVFLLPLLINGPLSQDSERRAIPLGLDLSGGVDVQISVDTAYTARQELSALKFQINRDFRRAVISGRVSVTPEEEEPGLRVQLREPEPDAAAAAQTLQEYVDSDILLPFDELALASVRGVILRLDPEYLTQRVDDAIRSATRIVKERVDALGVAQSDVRIEGGSRIRVQLPGQRDPQAVIRNLIRPATLEFRLAYPDQNPELYPDPVRMEDVLTGLITEEGRLRPGAAFPEGYQLFEGEAESTGGVEGKDPETGQPVRWYLLQDDPEIWGEHLRSVQARQGGQFGTQIVVGFELNGEGTRIFRDTTEAHKPTAEQSWRLAIVLEDRVRSAPVIQEAIPYGRGQISGNFTFDEARNLQNILRTGSLPARLVEGELSVVGPSLGEESIRSGRDAALIGGAMVLVFMLLYYAAAGGLAIIAVVVNVFLILGMLSLIRATLTLPGIAGIVLTIGMAVDANVLIFERIREELRAGKSLRNAIGVGFSRAFSAIFDANLTTLITALVLLQFGFGPVRGFALTMTFGIFATLFTGLFVTQVLLSVYFNLRQTLPLGRGHFLTDAKVNFIGLRHGAMVFSIILVLGSLGDLIQNRGPHLGVDFTGGVQFEVAVDRPIGQHEVEMALKDGGFVNPRVQTIERRGAVRGTGSDPGGATDITEEEMAWASNFLVRVPQSEIATDAEEGMDFGATEATATGALRDSFPNAHFQILETRAVSPETGARLRATAIGIVIVAALGIFIYVAVRFDRTYGVAALVALFHDVFITLGVVTLLDVEMSLSVVAALLTIMGYSLNDTIVCFDRMRENRGLMEGRDIFTVTNLSINQVLSRTIITSGTTLLAVGALLLLGGPGVWDFALTLFIGFTIGTYSSIFIAAPLVAQRVRRRQLAAAEAG